ncbi:MAG: hypothetical protein ABEJ65_10990 [bacterium]
MPTVSVSNSFFDIQISVTTDERPSVLQVVLAWIRIGPQVIEQTIKTLQEHWLKHDLGPHGTVGSLFEQDQFACPECKSPRANRKDFKDRHPVVPLLGEITIPERRVECQQCDSVYRPYDNVLGLPKHKQYTMESLMEGIRNVLVTSYERASSFMRADVSPNTLHRRVLESKPDGPGENGEYALVVVDATDVPKWKEDDQITLTLAHDIQQGPIVQERSTLNREVVALAAGAEEDIKSMLKEPEIQALMHDGKLNVDELCEIEGRCLWHVPYTARHLLYRDGISGDENKRLVHALSDIIFDDELGCNDREQKLIDWIEGNESKAPKTCRHVQGALDGIRNVDEHESLFDVITTSSMERQMVEVNKRFENGGGWTQKGAEALLWHYQLWLIEPENWLDQVLPSEESVMTEFLQNSLI